MAFWWPNRILPAIVAVVAARLIYVSFAQGPTSILIVFGAVMAGLPTLYLLAAHAIGFVYSLAGREPVRMTRWFGNGWLLASARPWRSEI